MAEHWTKQQAFESVRVLLDDKELSLQQALAGALAAVPADVAEALCSACVFMRGSEAGTHYFPASSLGGLAGARELVVVGAAELHGSEDDRVQTLLPKLALVWLDLQATEGASPAEKMAREAKAEALHQEWLAAWRRDRPPAQEA